MKIKAIIFDWGRTLFDSEAKELYPESEGVMEFCSSQGLRLACASLVSVQANATLDERKNQIENSVLRKFFEFVLVTDINKDIILAEIAGKLNLPREEILIVDDRTLRGIKYGNHNGHPTVWFQNGKFANELPNEETGTPAYTIHNLNELKVIINA
jgi:FMN phosphatase YigB (HAD superfamily)